MDRVYQTPVSTPLLCILLQPLYVTTFQLISHGKPLIKEIKNIDTLSRILTLSEMTTPFMFDTCNTQTSESSTPWTLNFTTIGHCDITRMFQLASEALSTGENIIKWCTAQTSGLAIPEWISPLASRWYDPRLDHCRLHDFSPTRGLFISRLLHRWLYSYESRAPRETAYSIVIIVVIQSYSLLSAWFRVAEPRWSSVVGQAIAEMVSNYMKLWDPICIPSRPT